MAPFPLRVRLDQLRVERDRGVENLGNRTVLLRLACDAGKPRIVEIRHLAAQGKGRLADPESLAFRFERDRGLGRQFSRRKARTLQAEGQRHGEASGMGRGDQFLGIGPLLVLEARLEGIGGLGEHAGLAGKVTGPVATSALPNCCCLADHVTLPRNSAKADLPNWSARGSYRTS